MASSSNKAPETNAISRLKRLEEEMEAVKGTLVDMDSMIIKPPSVAAAASQGLGEFLIAGCASAAELSLPGAGAALSLGKGLKAVAQKCALKWDPQNAFETAVISLLSIMQKAILATKEDIKNEKAAGDNLTALKKAKAAAKGPYKIMAEKIDPFLKYLWEQRANITREELEQFANNFILLKERNGWKQIIQEKLQHVIKLAPVMGGAKTRKIKNKKSLTRRK